MSRFFAGGPSDSDYSSSEEEDLYASSVESESEVSEDLEASVSASEDESGSDNGSDSDTPQKGQYSASQFLKGADSSDEDSDDDRVVVKSAKEKLLDEIVTAAEAAEDAQNDGDWVTALSEFDRMIKAQQKAIRQYNNVPLAVVKLLVEFEDSIAEARSQKLNPSNSKAVNTLNQRTKKAAKEYADRLEKYHKDPGNYNPEPPTLTELTESARGSPAPRSGDVDLSSETVLPTLLGIVQTRGKKKTDRTEQIQVLEKLLSVADTPYKKISVLMMLIPIRFDANSSGIMPTDVWKAIESNICILFEVLDKYGDEYIVIESAREAEDFEAGPKPGPGGLKQIPGSVPSLVERLDDEHTKALQVIDPHTTEYIERLRDQTQLYSLFLHAQTYTERNLKRIGKDLNGNEALCRLLVRRLDHIYYKPSSAIVASELQAWQKVPSYLDSEITPRLTKPPADAQEYTIDLVNSICQALYNQPNTVFRSKAMLTLIYHYALNDQYYKARDLMLMSHLQSSIHNSEPMLQVLFNRALVQVGLCAFRVGLVPEALQSLQEICSSSRLKELLGQGVAKFATGTVSDRSQILPFHMHINIELIECVYWTCSLLIEVPQSANPRNSTDFKKRTASKPFRRMLDFHDRQVFNGPSENTRDHIIQAAKALQQGNWKAARDLLRSIKVWSLLSGTSKILAMLDEKLQVEGLRTYLLVYCSVYDSLSLEYLQDLFQLPLEQVRAIITKMIVTDELSAVFDKSDEYLVFKPESSVPKLQILATQLAEKTMTLAERNDRLAGDGHGPDSVNKPIAKKSQSQSRPRVRA